MYLWLSRIAAIGLSNTGKLYRFLNIHSEGQVWCSGESCLTESTGRGFEAASPQIYGGKACLVFSLPQTPLMWEPPALGLPLS